MSAAPIEHRLREARRESAKYRLRLRDVEADRDRLQSLLDAAYARELDALLGEDPANALLDPEDFRRYTDPDTVLDAAGRPIPERVRDALIELRAERGYLFSPARQWAEITFAPVESEAGPQAGRAEGPGGNARNPIPLVGAPAPGK